ncbi:hypothetical protein B4Q13_16320, partial [Lacticaseibacillus rhamnosus]
MPSLSALTCRGVTHFSNLQPFTLAQVISYLKAFDRPLGAPTNVIMASQSFSYERQAQYDERLVMGCRTSRIGTKSMDLTYELWRGDERVGHGISALVAFDYAANTSVAVPDE